MLDRQDCREYQEQLKYGLPRTGGFFIGYTMKKIGIKLLAVLVSAVSLEAAAQEKVAGNSWRAEKDGFYKEIFMDSGIQLYDRKNLIAAEFLNAEYEVFLRTTGTRNDTLMQHKCFVGWEGDTNGALLYPDGSPRFRLLYVNGGLAGSHGRSLGEDGRERIREYVAAGGSYVGTCAGAFVASEGYIDVNDNYSPNKNYLGIWPGRVRDTYLADKYLTMYMEEDCPLLKYYDFGGDRKVENIYHLNGPYAALEPEDCPPAGTLPLLRVDYDTIPPQGPSIDNKVTCWAYKANKVAGTVISMSSHPEEITEGERLHLMAAFLQYAMDNTGTPAPKGKLVSGEVREMNKASEDNDPAFTKIGDRQYHHFEVDVPDRTRKLEISLEGYPGEDDVDLSLAAHKGGLAFLADAQFKDESAGCSKTIVLKRPAAGKYFISVFCETAPDSSFGENGVVYSGRTDLLNGVPYKIKVVVK